MAKKKGNRTAARTQAPAVQGARRPVQPSALPVRVEPSSGTTGVARRISWWSLVALVFLVPVATSNFTDLGADYSFTFDAYDLVKVAVQRVLILVALSAWVWDLLRNGGQIRHNPVDWLIIALIIWVGVTTITSIHWPTALFGASQRNEGFITFITYALTYFLVLQFAGDPARVRVLAQAFFWASAIVAIYGLLQFAGLVHVSEDVPWDDTNRAFSTYGNPNMLGGFLIFSTVVALGLALSEKRGVWRLVYWVGFGLSGLALIVSYTRGAWIGGVVGLVLLGIIAWRQRASVRRIDLAPACVFVAAGLALIIRSLFSSSEVMNVGRRIASILQFSSGSGQTRTQIWQAAGEAISERPILGWGTDTFNYLFYRFVPAGYIQNVGGTRAADNAHDYPLQLASTVGIPGALLFYGVLVWAGIRSYKVVFKRSAEGNAIILGAFWAASAGYVVHLFFGISVVGITFLVWITLALVLAPTSRSIQVKARRWGTAAAVALCIAAAVGIGYQGVALAADRAHEMAKTAPSHDERVAAAVRAVELNPFNPVYRGNIGLIWLDRLAADMQLAMSAHQEGEDIKAYMEAIEKSFTNAEAALNDAIAFAPRDYDNYVNLVAVYVAGGWTLDPGYYEKAIETAERGLEIAPLGTAIRVRLAQALLDTGRTAEVVTTLEYSLELDPRDGDAALSLADLYRQQGEVPKALAILRSVEALAPGQAGVRDAIRALEADTSSQ